MANHTISLPEEMNARIERQLEYGDSKSGWIRQGIQYRFIVDEILPEEMDDEERLEYVEAALRAHADDQ